MSDIKNDFVGNEKKETSFFESIANDKQNFVGFTYDLDYETARILTNDKWKLNIKGIPHGTFLIAIYENELQKFTKEGILLRVIGSAKIPQSSMIIESMIDTYMEQPEARKSLSPDIYTKNYYQFSGMECRILGTFFFDTNEKLVFGTDIENFLGAHKYKVYKPSQKELELIVNSKNENDNEDEIGLKEDIGFLRYSSSRSYTVGLEDYAVKVDIKPIDIVARRTAFFGMTRTGKSNTIKIIISAIVKLNEKFTEFNSNKHLVESDEKFKKPIGQIIFDINGEYTFKNKQDEGSIHDQFEEKVVRYSVSKKKIEKYDDVKPLQYNFYDDTTLEESFNLLSEQLSMADNIPQFVQAFLNVNLFDDSYMNNPDLSDKEKRFFKNQLGKKKALYKCILKKANFSTYEGYRLYFTGIPNFSISKEGLLIEEAIKWFENNEENLKTAKSSSAGKNVWDKDFDALMNMLLAKKGGGFKKLFEFNSLHSIKSSEDYKVKINSALRDGKIILVDLSTTSEQAQKVYITKLCSYIFNQSMQKFTNDETPEFIQMYFEEAHNIFPKDDKDLKNIYNRLAKEGAKLNLGISYSTQEVSSISPSILKNTQNWFISHLNNRDEIKTLEKYYDFSDFSNSILRNSDVGYARIKTYSNNFIIPVQIKKFEVK